MAGTIQDDLKQEIEAMAKMKGVTLSLNDYWRSVSRYSRYIMRDLTCACIFVLILFCTVFKKI